MKIEEQVLTIEQMNHLKELGLEVKDTAMCWVEQIYDRCGNLLPKKTFKLEYDKFEISLMNRKSSVTPTLTLQEVLDLLPPKIEVGPNHSKYLLEVYTDSHLIRYATGSGRELSGEFFHGSILNAAYNMLCWCAENGYLDKE